MVVVTGANGFIGSVMVSELNRANIPVIACVDTVSLKERPQPLTAKKYDHFLLKDELWNFLNLPKTIQDCSWIIHMGANSSTTETNAEFLTENNTLYTERIFEWCSRHKKNLIYASSAATYGAGELGYDDSTDANHLKPLNLYGESKVAVDRWVQKQNTNPVHWYGLKFFNVYGPNEYHKGPMASLVYKAFHQIMKNGELELFKSYRPDYQDGEQMRDFVYVKDVTAWMLELMQKKPKSGVYNMGFGKARTWVDLATAVFHSVNKPVNIKFVPMPESIKHQYQYFTEANMTNWINLGMSQPKWSIESGVADYLKNYLLKDQSPL